MTEAQKSLLLQANEMLNMIEDPKAKARLTIRIASSLSDLDRAKAVEMAREAMQCAHRLSDIERKYILPDLIDLCNDLALFSDARAIIEELRRIYEGEKKPFKDFTYGLLINALVLSSSPDELRSAILSAPPPLLVEAIHITIKKALSRRKYEQAEAVIPLLEPAERHRAAVESLLILSQFERHDEGLYEFVDWLRATLQKGNNT